jgi:hypothetical protein
MVKRRRNPTSPFARPERRLFRGQHEPDDWLVVDDTLLADLFRYLPRMPRWQTVRSLDFRRLSHVRSLPPGLRCDQLNLTGTAIRSLPADLRVKLALDLVSCKRLKSLPAGLHVDRLDLRGCTALTSLPEGLRTGYLDARFLSLTEIPAGLRCVDLDLEGTRLRTVPPDLHVKQCLNLANCREFRELPADLRVRILKLSGCSALTRLPSGIDVFDLDIEGCTALADWEEPAQVNGRLWAAGCAWLTALPRQLTNLESLDVRDCPRLRELPPGLRVREWVEVAGSGLTGLPESLRETPLRWRGVRVDERIAFHPERLTAEEVIHERNAERRRVMLERYGFEQLITSTKAHLLDADTDPGGPRRLLRLPLGDDEALVCVSVRCPSTGRHYVLRVPPTMQTCRQAIAWTAGFEDPMAYRPILET